MENGVYHVTQRATDDEVFFVAPFDYFSFCQLLGLTIKRAEWRLHGFCLMTNHVHMLLATYVEEFNARYGRRGALVQGRYKSKLVETEAHYLECLRYFALNPVGAGLCERAEHWPGVAMRATAVSLLAWRSYFAASSTSTCDRAQRGPTGRGPR